MLSFAEFIMYGLSVVNEFVLAWSTYTSLQKASEPKDYDVILSRIISELQFHCETLLAMLFFMATSTTPGPSVLISWTVACLLYTLLTYGFFESLTGDMLHKHLGDITIDRILFASLAKVPAVAVTGTLCALALTEWYSAWTVGVLCAIGAIIIIVMAVRARIYLLPVQLWRSAKGFFAKKKDGKHRLSISSIKTLVNESIESPPSSPV